MVVAASPFLDMNICLPGKIALVFVSGAFSTTVMEYVTGMLMEDLFRVRYWDYSNRFLNIKGYICLRSTLCWGGLTVFCACILHVYVERLMYAIPERWLTVMVFGLTVVNIGDFTLAFRAALDIKDILIMYDEAKNNIARLKKRVDVVIAFTNQGISDAVDKTIKNGMEDFDEAYDKINISLGRAKKRISSLMKANPTMISSRYSESLKKLRERVLKK